MPEIALNDTTALHKCAAVPRRARIQGSYTFASLNSRLDSNREEKDIARLDDATRLLQEAVILPLLMPEVTLNLRRMDFCITQL